MTASNTTFTVFSGTGFFLAVVPLSWLLQSRNVHVGQCMYLIWAALVCLIYFVDSIVWNGNVNNWAPMWCDIGAFTYPFTRLSDLTDFVQPLAFKLVLQSQCLHALFASSVAFTTSLR